jgi:hypothetical protein
MVAFLFLLFSDMGDCPIHGRMLNSIPGLDSAETSGTPPNGDNEKVSLDVAQCPLGVRALV